MALVMYRDLATHQKVPKWAILWLNADFYPFEYLYVG